MVVTGEMTTTSIEREMAARILEHSTKVCRAAGVGSAVSPGLERCLRFGTGWGRGAGAGQAGKQVWAAARCPSPPGVLTQGMNGLFVTWLSTLHVGLWVGLG